MVWCGRGQRAFAARVAKRARLTAVGVGVAPESELGGDADEAAFEGVARFDDPLRAVAGSGAGVLLLVSAEGAAPGAPSPADDVGLLGACREAGVRVVSVEPLPGDVGLVGEVEKAERGGVPAMVVPLLRSGRVFGDALEMLEQVGAVRSVAVHARCSPVHGTLGSRLFDAMSAVERLIGMPDRIDCSVTGGLGAPESLRGLAGHASAHLRYAGRSGAGCSAAVIVSNRAGGWFRGVTVLGDSGVLRFSDRKLELTSPSGEPLDQSTAPPHLPRRDARPFGDLFTDAGEEEDEAADLFAAELKRALDPGLGIEVHAGKAEALAMCETALLSARTGAQEDTQTIMDMRGKR